MSEHNSPMFLVGWEDGERDAQRVAQCPPVPAVGPEPPYPAYPVMYNRGYEAGFEGAVPHICTEKCRQNGQR